jgi:hypothetical protein
MFILLGFKRAIDFSVVEFAKSPQIFNDEGAPSNSPGWQKEKGFVS